jgi:hypothetical protein
MSTETTASSATAAAEKTAAASTTTSPQITLRQFALETSVSDQRVALLHGFVFEEQVARRFKDTEANYAARFEAFATKPV